MTKKEKITIKEIINNLELLKGNADSLYDLTKMYNFRIISESVAEITNSLKKIT